MVRSLTHVPPSLLLFVPSVRIVPNQVTPFSELPVIVAPDRLALALAGQSSALSCAGSCGTDAELIIDAHFSFIAVPKLPDLHRLQPVRTMAQSPDRGVDRDETHPTELWGSRRDAVAHVRKSYLVAFRDIQRRCLGQRGSLHWIVPGMMFAKTQGLCRRT